MQDYIKLFLNVDNVARCNQVFRNTRICFGYSVVFPMTGFPVETGAKLNWVRDKNSGQTHEFE